jgi:3-oxoadipate enol-lactonase
MSTHRERGLREYEALMGARPERALEGLRRQSPQLFETLVDSVFGGPLSRPELPRDKRELATIAILAAAGGAEAQLRSHVRAALELRCAPGWNQQACG